MDTRLGRSSYLRSLGNSVVRRVEHYHGPALFPPVGRSAPWMGIGRGWGSKDARPAAPQACHDGGQQVLPVMHRLLDEFGRRPGLGIMARSPHHQIHKHWDERYAAFGNVVAPPLFAA